MSWARLLLWSWTNCLICAKSAQNWLHYEIAHTRAIAWKLLWLSGFSGVFIKSDFLHPFRIYCTKKKSGEELTWQMKYVNYRFSIFTLDDSPRCWRWLTPISVAMWYWKRIWLMLSERWKSLRVDPVNCSRLVQVETRWNSLQPSWAHKKGWILREKNSNPLKCIETIKFRFESIPGSWTETNRDNGILF